MKKLTNNSNLRQHRQKDLEIAAGRSEDLAGASLEKMSDLIQSLEVHQIELKMQNDELRRVQSELEKARDKYSHLYDFSPVGYFTVGEKGIIEEVNLTGAAMIGIERSALTGKPFSRFILREDQDIFNKHRRLLLESETSMSCELRLVKKDGHAFYACMEFMVLKNKDNDSRQIRAAVSDITERKGAEKKVKEYSDKLEKEVDFLQRMETMGTFTGGIAHDFTNVLTIIISYSNFVLSGVGPKSPLRQDIEKIIRNARHGLSLTHWLLLFSRNQPLERKFTNLNTLIIDMEKMLRRVITKEIDLVMSLEPDLGRVLINPSQVELMIINLVVNAVDAMPKGGVLTIVTKNEGPDECPDQMDTSGHQGPKMVLSVSDTGIGMDKETQAKIFQPFFTTKKKGTGLGLSIAFDAIQKNGGFMQVYSRPGHGSTLKVYLPIVPDEETSGTL